MSLDSARAHLSIAETGKRAALRGDHTTALGHYREAMHLAVSSGAPEVFFRHYLEATMESLELMNDFGSVIEYCERAVEHYREHPPAHPVAWLDLASIHQRHGCVLLKQGDVGPARVAFEQAIDIAARAPAHLPLAEALGGWLRRGLFVSPERMLAEQRRYRYFCVRPETVEQDPGTP
ncbi:hypothetical protein OM076_36020 [Solirubrobacter ginsenosidimutans]|uniref:Tetratricopeptide repeat protein n=1 Tax=Solirubrobacter ginsenosidimutans TaxID=490573 RepID=A0A9X3N1S8_9ACTN|nr:hypothetical protein [Solirubrobacter ginsenosidimutans]MDA0165731.1 hypothetical protein [Solirubrobacter ginsenosidimutans]